MKNTLPEPAFPTRLLLLGRPEAWLSAAWQTVETALGDAGCTVVARATRHSLVRDALESSPQALLLWAPGEAADLPELLEALALLSPALPGVCVADTAERQRGPGLGLQVWLSALPAPEELLQQLRWAVWLSDRFAALQAQLDDRKWTERAKGLLMAGQELDEASAFKLLREAAMHAHLRLGEVARSVVRAAEMAEALNLAGQQRMLSQRLVKLMAQRAAGIEARRAKVLQDESCARVDANLARLQALLTATEAVQAVNQAWAALRALLPGKPTAAVLTQADAAAEALLTVSDQLAGAIEAGGAGRPLQLVNLCGRQRMLSQRLAKDALLADLLPTGGNAAGMAAGLKAFEAGLLELEAAPLSSAEIRASQALVRDEWLRLLRSLRDVQGPEAAAGLARSSELLLAQLDRLTEQYQQSLQLILG
nr:ANTAR domain-containing protein [uncultured Roseateles sp.]